MSLLHTRPPILLTILLSLCVHNSHAATRLQGTPHIIDGDSLAFGATQIRLHGIDAPEWDQRCTTDKGAEWDCGTRATQAITERIGEDGVTCHPLGSDRYDRTIARCFVRGRNLNAWLVRHGHALAYRRYSGDYIHEEAAARAEEVGLWSGQFIPPWEWRQAEARR